MAFFSKSLRNWTKSTISSKVLRNGLPQNTQNSQNLLLSILPQNTQNAQNLLLSFFPQNTQNSQNLLLSILPQISDAILGGALVSARLCRLPEQEVHQPSKQ